MPFVISSVGKPVYLQDGGIILDNKHDSASPKHPRLKRVLKVLLLSVLSLVLMLVVGGIVFVNIFAAHLQKNILPLAQVNLEDYDLEKTSYIYYYNEDGDIQLLQQLYTTTDRRWASYEELPQDLINAAIAI